MIFVMGFLFMFLGLLMLITDWFFPIMTVEQLIAVHNFTFPIRLMGVVFVVIGMMIVVIRSSGLTMFMDLPNSRLIPCIHSRIRGNDPDAKFLRTRRVDLEILRTKNKVIKDTGGGFRINGHSCRRTYETIGFTVPDWLSSYFHEVKEKFQIRDSDEWRALRTGLLGLKENKKVTEEIEVGGVKQIVTKILSKEDQLRRIMYNDKMLLESALSDPIKKAELLAMGWGELRRLELLLFDGVTHNGDDVELFIDSATPNEQDILERQTFVNEMERHKRYKDPGEMDLAKLVPAIVIIILVAAVAAIMLRSVFG